MVKPNDNPRVADGDYGEGDNDLNNEPGDLAIIQLPLPAPGLLAHQVPMYICYNPHVHGIRQIDNDSQEVNAQKHSAFSTTFTIFTSKVENMGKNG